MSPQGAQGKRQRLRVGAASPLAHSVLLVSLLTVERRVNPIPVGSWLLVLLTRDNVLHSAPRRSKDRSVSALQ